MAVYNKFQDFVEQLAKAKHDLDAHALHVYLSNAAPSAAADAVKADLAEIAAGAGYTADGIDTLNTIAEAAGVLTVTGTKAVWTSSGAFATFRYVVLMNFTQGTPAKPLIAWWDYASGLSLASGETFSVKFNNSETTGTIFTLE